MLSIEPLCEPSAPLREAYIPVVVGLQPTIPQDIESSMKVELKPVKPGQRFRKHQLSQLQRIAHQVEAISCGDAILAISLVMVHDDVPMAHQPVGRSTPNPHRHEIHRDIADPDIIDMDKPQHVLEIGRDPERGVESAKPVVAALSAIERRMRRLVAEHHHPGLEEAGGIITDAMGQVMRIHKMDVAVHGIYLVVPELKYMTKI